MPHIEDIDFPCSYTFRAGLAELLDGEILPRIETDDPHQLSKEEWRKKQWDYIQQLEGEMQEPPWSKKQWDYVQQLMAEMKHLENKLQEHITEKKRRDHDIL